MTRSADDRPACAAGIAVAVLCTFAGSAAGQGAGGVVRASGISLSTGQVGTLGTVGAGVHSVAEVGNAAYRIDELAASSVHGRDGSIPAKTR